MSGEWFYLLIGEEPIKTALQPGANGSECGASMPRAHGPRAKVVKLLTPTARMSRPPFGRPLRGGLSHRHGHRLKALLLLSVLSQVWGS